MISINNLSIHFTGTDLFSNASFLVNDRDRIGLVGKNGSGKTTLMNIIAGYLIPQEGDVVIPSNTSIGFLQQEMETSSIKTIFEEALTAFTETLKLEEKIHQLTKEISERPDYESKEYHRLIHNLSEANERFHIVGGQSIEGETEKVLTGLGFKRSDFQRPISEFSSGWQMRVELAKILLQKPDVVLLDEPTNHLDIESIQWLESFLASYRGAVVLVSHDRAFLDNVTSRTIEISLGRIYDYKASWSKFVELRKERREQQIAAFRNQQKMIVDTEKFIERFRYKATKAVQVQSKIKQLNKVDRLEVDEEDISGINIKFPLSPRSGTIVVEAEGLSKSYGSLTVLKKIDFKIHRGEKVAFVGRNGEGKTTFSRIIIKEIDHQGLLKIGHNVKTGYFAQNQDELLNENKTVFETIDDIAKGDIRSKIRDMLGAFLFRGDDIDKKVKVLSGGERSRLALVKLLLEPYNLLVLDEPTNHLDMRSKDILKQALIKYDGTMILVSHDRDFLDGIVNKIYEFRHNRIKEHIGGIYDFLRRKKIENLREIERKDERKSELLQENFSSNKQKYLDRKEYDRNMRKLRKRLEDSEREIEKIESEMAAFDKIISSPEYTSAGANDFFVKYQELKVRHNEEMEKWAQYTHEVEVFLNNNEK